MIIVFLSKGPPQQLPAHPQTKADTHLQTHLSPDEAPPTIVGSHGVYQYRQVISLICSLTIKLMKLPDTPRQQHTLFLILYLT